jgi:hypothetical protein
VRSAGLLILLLLATPAEARCRNGHCTWHGKHHNVSARHHRRREREREPEPVKLTNRLNRAAKGDRQPLACSTAPEPGRPLARLPDAFARSVMLRPIGPWRLP